MDKILIFAILASFFVVRNTLLSAQDMSGITVFSESGFPASDSTAPTSEQLGKLFHGSRLVGADQLREALDSPSTRLLIMPYGSAFPEDAWQAIKSFLDRGGNLLVLGGRPFTRAAFREGGSWRLRDYSVRFIRPLMIDQYQETPGSEGLRFETNPEVPLQLASFPWKRAFSPVIRLSAVDLYKRGGSAGSIDAHLDTLAWGTKDGRKLSAPVIQVDHYQNGFDRGRWIFVNADVTPEFFENSALVRSLLERALMGAEEFTVRPGMPLYLPGEPVEVEIVQHSNTAVRSNLSLRINTFPESEPTKRSSVTSSLSSSEPIVLPPPTGKGLYVVEAQLLDGNSVRAIYHSAFWIRDEAYLRSGPRLTVNRDYFEVDDIHSRWSGRPKCPAKC